MQTVQNRLEENYKDIVQLIPKDLGIRKKIEIFKGYNDTNKDILALVISQKSRFLRKDATKLEEIYTTVSNYTTCSFDTKILFISSPLCSHAKKMLEDNSWEIIVE